jgi:pilus assembly protein CpaB
VNLDRQKILFIFVGAWISAALLTWLVYAKAVAPHSEKMADAIAAMRDLPAGTRLKKTDLKLVKVTEKDMPRTAVTDMNQLIDRALLYPLNSNELISSTKVTGLSSAEGLAAIIEPGKRAISVTVSDVSGAGGLVQPRSHVDVLFTKTGSMKEAVTSTILQDIVVLSVGRLTEAGQTIDPRATRPQNQAATLLVTPEQAQKIELAKNQGKISLALRNPMDKAVTDEDPATAYSLNIGPKTVRGNVPNIRNDGVWKNLMGDDPPPAPKPRVEEKKEPPRPRAVVDVYRGDKHVQEIFQ